MIKIYTQKSNKTTLKSSCSKEIDMDNGFTDSVYQSIKPNLDNLIKNPPEEIINKILAYAKQH